MKRRLAVILVTVMASMTLAIGASAHSAPPCNDTPEPGNSAYAKHHIVALAKDGGLGNDGHKPGTHQGFSLCLGVHG